jgi:hypothetical protein
MANQWLRLWHDMPTDPKWRTIAKASGQRIGDVMAVYCHLLVCASNATERGRTQSFNSEDVASALDLETEQVEAIVKAMQARVLDGDKVAGWEKRQALREDGSAERSRAWREAQKEAAEREANAAERKRPLDKTREDKKKSNTPHTPKGGKSAAVDLSTWIASVKAAGEKPVMPEDDPVFAYAESIGLPREFLHLAWLEFKHHYQQAGAKRYIDWRAVFRKAVRGNWLKLWWLEGERYSLTTRGLQAQRANQEKAA